MTELTNADDQIRVFHGDSRDVLKAFPDAHFDSVVCDPPYALVSITKRFGAENAAPAKVGASGAYARASAGFMGQKWDTGETAFAVEFWAEVYRVLKPGGHVIAFSGTRTYHRLACAIEDAGFEMRDMIAWLYGSGFPKSHDVSKGIDKARKDNGDWLAVGQWLRAQREAAGFKQKEVAAMWPSATGGLTGCVANWELGLSCPKWDQWLQLKAFLDLSDDMDAEVWRLNGRKGTPGEAWYAREVVGRNENGAGNGSVVGLGSERSMDSEFDITAPATDAARQWQGWGTALKPALEPIVLARKPLTGTVAANVLQHGTGALNIAASRIMGEPTTRARTPTDFGIINDDGWRPSPGVNGSEDGRWPANVIHDGSEEVVGAFPETSSGGGPAVGTARTKQNVYGDPTVSMTEPRGQNDGSAARFFYSAKADAEDRLGSKHPTVKPVDLMAYLVRLVTPPGGVTLDPFAGSGTTGVGAMREGMRCVLIERKDSYVADIMRKLAWARGEGRLTALELARLDTPEAKAKASGADLPLFG